MSEELWKSIKGFEGYYEVSNKGRVRSLDRHVPRSDGNKQFVKGKFLVISYDTGGYSKVNLNRNGKATVGRVTRLVAENFIPNPYNKPTVNHINGNKKDDRVENLEWNTMSENIIHAFETELKTVYSGEEHVASRLTNEEVLEMRRLYQSGNYTYLDLAEKYKVARITISRIITRLSWKHI